MSLPLKNVEPSVRRKVFYVLIHTLAPVTNALIKKTQNQLAFFIDLGSPHITSLGYTSCYGCWPTRQVHILTGHSGPGDLDSAHWGLWGWSGGNVDILASW